MCRSLRARQKSKPSLVGAGPAILSVDGMSTRLSFRRFIRRFVLQFIFTLIIASIGLGGILIGSFVCHFAWWYCSGASIRRVEDAPLWLIPSSFIIACALLWIVVRRLRLFEWMFTLMKRYDV